MKSFLVASLVSLLSFSQVESHGWLNQPCPRSTSSAAQAPATCTTSTGTASTRAPCGRANAAGAATPAFKATWIKGTTANVAFQRANGHGGSGKTVTMNLSPSTTFTAPGTALVNNADQSTTFTMNTQLATPQSNIVKVPTVANGAYTVQFVWSALDGSKWYDCADITIADPPASDPCPAKLCSDICTSAGTVATCSCKAGRVFDTTTTPASTTKCVDLPPAAKVTLIVKKDVKAMVGTTSGQDAFTDALEQAFPALLGYANFDDATYDGTQSTVKLDIDSKSASMTGKMLAAALSNFVKNPSSVSSFASVYPPVSVQLDTDTPVMAPTEASPTTASPTSQSSNTNSPSSDTTTSPTSKSVPTVGSASSTMNASLIFVMLSVLIAAIANAKL